MKTAAKVVMLVGALVGCASSSTQTTRGAEPVESAAQATSGGDRTRGLVLIRRDGASAFEVRVSGTARQGSRQSPLTEGMRLRSGDVITLEVEVDRRVNLYVAYADSQGQPVLLYPKSGSPLTVRAGERVRLPGPGEEFALDENPGEETLLVVASERPLAESDPEAEAALARIIPPEVRTSAGASVRPSVAQPVSGERHGSRVMTAPRRASSAAAPSPTTSAAQSAGVATPASTTGGHERAGDVYVGSRTRGILLRAATQVAETRVQADDGGVVLWRLRFRHDP